MSDQQQHPHMSSPAPGHDGEPERAQGGGHQHATATRLTLVTATEERDPVCGMTVKPNTPYQSSYAGTRYSFCGAACQQKFEADPTRYTHPHVASAADTANAAPDTVYTLPHAPRDPSGPSGELPKVRHGA